MKHWDYGGISALFNGLENFNEIHRSFSIQFYEVGNPEDFPPYQVDNRFQLECGCICSLA